MLLLKERNNMSTWQPGCLNTMSGTCFCRHDCLWHKVFGAATLVCVFPLLVTIRSFCYSRADCNRGFLWVPPTTAIKNFVFFCFSIVPVQKTCQVSEQLLPRSPKLSMTYCTDWAMTIGCAFLLLLCPREKVLHTSTSVDMQNHANALAWHKRMTLFTHTQCLRLVGCLKSIWSKLLVFQTTVCGDQSWKPQLQTRNVWNANNTAQTMILIRWMCWYKILSVSMWAGWSTM